MRLSELYIQSLIKVTDDMAKVTDGQPKLNPGQDIKGKIFIIYTPYLYKQSGRYVKHEGKKYDGLNGLSKKTCVETAFWS